MRAGDQWSPGWLTLGGPSGQRHGLILLVALGESIVAIGVGAEVGVNTGVVAVAVLGTSVACALWWV